LHVNIKKFIDNWRIAMTKRFILGNLIYYIDKNNVLLVNLISFRRQKISTELLTDMMEIENKINNGIVLSEKENKILNDLYLSKQILPKEKIIEIDQNLQSELELNLDKFAITSYTLNLTHQCNFKCSYCYQNKYNFKPEYKQFMTTKDIDLIKEYLSQGCFDANEVEEIVFSGGESLLPTNIDTINYALSNLKSKKFIMFTNGVNLYDYRKHIDYNLIDEFQVSFDGTAEIIKYINKNPNSRVFEKIIEGIKHIDSLNKEISIIVMWTKELEQYIDNFISILIKNEIINKSNLKVKFILAKDYYSTSTINKDFYNLDYICDIIKKINPKLSQIGSSLEIFGEGSTIKYLIHRPLNQKKSLLYNRCDLTQSIPFVFEPNGEIFWCLCLGNKNGCIGNYKEKMHFNKDKVLNLGNRTIFKIEKCKTCELRYLCAGGCPLPLTSCDSDLYQPVCGLYGLEEFWDCLEKLA
jgi:radical SAM protein with 4Fe4S-binding SPASM domain